jgi:transposase
MVKNQLHAEEAEAEPNIGSLKRLKLRIKFLNKQEKEIKSEIDSNIKNESEIKNQLENVTSIPGIGNLTAVTILAETNGFELIRNKRQLASYAGFDIKEKQSGTSVKGKSKISKKGNRYLRKAMHLPSLTAVKYDENFKEIYNRLVSKHGIKMKVLIAIQRKLLELTYTLFKNNTKYNKEFELIKREQPEMAAAL